jgi:hypothetical protein
MLKLTRERWAQIGITIQFLALVRTLSEFLRLRYTRGAEFSITVGGPFVTGALIATLFCWTAVTLFFSRRYTLSIFISMAAVVVLLVYKVAAMGW